MLGVVSPAVKEGWQSVDVVGGLKVGETPRLKQVLCSEFSMLSPKRDFSVSSDFCFFGHEFQVTGAVQRSLGTLHVLGEPLHPFERGFKVSRVNLLAGRDRK